MFDFQLPKALLNRRNTSLLTGILRGIERESLRIDQDGWLSQSPHPSGLGSALTHPHITTDFSEALLEFITPPTHEIDDLFLHLEAAQKFTVSQLGNEMLWPTSMPCLLGSDDNIPVARYGSSNNGKMKTVYRLGLGQRYGRHMQTVAGVHYNFSLPNAFWALLHREQNSILDLQQFKDERYFGLIRNFRRHYWLLIYLFGASPALCKSFVADKQHNLTTMKDGKTLYLPDATSLRMGDLGYQSGVQEALYVCYNTKQSYIKSLCCAITQSHPAYEHIGLQDNDGNYQQLNTSILQIENEFYSAIRPKRTANPGETALRALQTRGIEYIEVRCLDVNPFEPLGINEEQIRFLDTFLIYCALQSSPPTSQNESEKILRNQKRVVNAGRQEGLLLETADNGDLDLRDWGLSLVENMQKVAELLDHSQHTDDHQQALEMQKNKLIDSRNTPSAKILMDLDDKNLSYGQYAFALARQHDDALRSNPLNEKTVERMQQMAEESLYKQNELERASTEPFDSFIKNYYKQYTHCSQ